MSINHSNLHRHSIRLPEYDYTACGAYFVTVCTHARRCVLGRVVDADVALSACGRVAEDALQWLAARYAYVDLDIYCVMPNHIHFILMINDGRGGSRTALTGRKPLGRLVGTFKTYSTKQINQIQNTPGTPFWQRNYYESVIRNDRQMDAVREYIQNNPINWELDKEFREE